MKSPKRLKPRPADDPVQSERFLSTAKELGAGESRASFEAALRVITPAKAAPKDRAKKRPTG